MWSVCFSVYCIYWIICIWSPFVNIWLTVKYYIFYKAWHFSTVKTVTVFSIAFFCLGPFGTWSCSLLHYFLTFHSPSSSCCSFTVHLEVHLSEVLSYVHFCVAVLALLWKKLVHMPMVCLQLYFVGETSLYS